jgi:hypothetical protein
MLRAVRLNGNAALGFNLESTVNTRVRQGQGTAILTASPVLCRRPCCYQWPLVAASRVALRSLGRERLSITLRAMARSVGLIPASSSVATAS